jgi:hypothetical protein
VTKINELSGETMYHGDIEKFPLNKTENGIVITQSYPIHQGIGKYDDAFYLKDSQKYLPSSRSMVYFLDYVLQYQNAQDCISDLKRKYTLLKKHTTAQDGWNIANAHDGDGFCGVRKVFVENGRVTKYRTGNDVEIQITSGGKIINNKTTISYQSPHVEGIRTHLIVIDIYFL